VGDQARGAEGAEDRDTKDVQGVRNGKGSVVSFLRDPKLLWSFLNMFGRILQILVSRTGTLSDAFGFDVRQIGFSLLGVSHLSKLRYSLYSAFLYYSF